VLAKELENLLSNGHGSSFSLQQVVPPPLDSDRRTTLLDVRQPNRHLEELVLERPVKDMIERLLNDFRQWDVLESNGLSPVRRVLFCGPSGCGKTAMAEVLASELAIPLVYVRFDSVVSSLLGETAANLRKVIDYARRGEWVIFFDEFDAIGRSRDDATEHGEIKRVLNSFLQIIDNFNGHSLIVAATNFERVLDLAIWRRFDEVIRFEKPNENQIRLVLRKRLGPVHFSDEQVDCLTSQLIGSSYADAERICFDIRKDLVLRGDREVRSEDIQSAIARHSYRKSVVEKATVSGTATVDRD
jgi:SpoVK/Ycf46/Vps4 family AAA+-type ATPase